ncbi:MAG: 3-hydroxyacyl-CoA dehydrogenase NAD-binding domain-containing protein [Janthinobacterium lividum]
MTVEHRSGEGTLNGPGPAARSEAASEHAVHTVTYRTEASVALITFGEPPANALTPAVRAGVIAALVRAIADPQIRAIVLAGSGRGFSTGVEIGEVADAGPGPARRSDAGTDAGIAPAVPSLCELVDAVDNCPKPVVAAVGGFALGGGLELALAAHYRLGTRHANLALPDVKLGLMPAAGATQRLPRAVGLAAALDMLAFGKPRRAWQFIGTPLFAHIYERDAVEPAYDFAAALRTDAPLPRLREWPLLNVDRANVHPSADPSANLTVASLIAAARAQLPNRRDRFPAGHAIVDAVEAGVALGFDAGLRHERALYATLIALPASRALRHAFFAERRLSDIPGVPPDTPVRDLRQVAVIGAGKMGAGIAAALLIGRLPVLLIDRDAAALATGLDAVRRALDASVQTGRLHASELPKRLALLGSYNGSADATLRSADLVIEAVANTWADKRRAFAAFEQYAKPGAVLASTSDAPDLDGLAASTARPQDMIGMHFFYPAPLTRLLELVRGVATAADVVATARRLAARLGKVAVVCGVGEGFIAERMMGRFYEGAYGLLAYGLLPEQIDAALERFGFAMGPFRLSDLTGNDVLQALRRRRTAGPAALAAAPIADRLCAAGRLGQKSRAGWYDYPADARDPRPSPFVASLVAAHLLGRDIARPPAAMDNDERIVEPLLRALAEEGRAILDAGIALRASDIDMVFLAGYGFPLWRGGPMFDIG